MSNMVVNTNVLALNSQRSMKVVGVDQAKASARLSSGMKINSAADDAAGLAISEKMRAQIRGLDMASKNASDGISMIQTAEGGLQEIGNMLQRVRELAVQAATGTNTTGDIANITKEVTELNTEISAMATRTTFNTLTLVAGTGASYTFQIGPDSAHTMTVTIPGAGAYNTGAASGAATDIDAVNSMIVSLATDRATLGAYQNRLEYTIRSLDVSSENLSASESRIRDADMAKEMMKFTRANVLTQAATSMLSQANQLPNNLLQLLR